MALSPNETYNILIAKFQQFATAHEMINAFSHGQIDLADLAKDPTARYPLMHVVPEGFGYSIVDTQGNSRQMRFRIIFFDCPQSKDDKADNQREIISDCDQLHRDLLAIIQKGDLFGKNIDIVDAGEGIPFMEEYANVLTGVENTITLGFGWTLDACEVPGDFDFIPPGTIADVSASSRIQHNDLQGLQGGSTDQRYHLTLEQWQNLGGGGVTSVNSETGDVVLDAEDVGADPTGTAAAALVSANNYTDSEVAGLQPLDTDLTAIAALAPVDDDFIQRKGGIWVKRTVDEVRVDLDVPGYHENTILALQALGSQVKAEPVGLWSGPGLTTNSGNLASGTTYWVAVFMPKADTINGVLWYQLVQGAYTADAENRFQLCTYSGGLMTQVAASTNDGNLWKGTSATWQKKAFSAQYPAAKGIYFICGIYHASAVTTNPAIGGYLAAQSSSVPVFDFTNSAKLQGTLAGQSVLPTPQLISGISAVQAQRYLALY